MFLWCLVFDPHLAIHQSNIGARLRKVTKYHMHALMVGLEGMLGSQTLTGQKSSGSCKLTKRNYELVEWNQQLKATDLSFFFSLWWKWAESLKVHPERVLGWVSLDETHPNLGEHGFRVPVMGRFCWGYGCVAWIWIGHDGKRPDIIWFSSEYVPQSRFSVFTHSWFLCTF